MAITSLSFVLLVMSSVPYAEAEHENIEEEAEADGKYEEQARVLLQTHVDLNIRSASDAAAPKIKLQKTQHNATTRNAESRVQSFTNMSSKLSSATRAVNSSNGSNQRTAQAANISFTVVGASRQEYELKTDSGKSSQLKDKVILVLLNMFGCGVCGIDRCYMGQTCSGVIKGLTLGGLGFWALLDYIGILVTCLSKAEYINFLGYEAEFKHDTVTPAFWIAISLLLLKCCCGGRGAAYYRSSNTTSKLDSKPA